MTQQPGAPQGEGSPYSRHIPALDGVRGLAILSVMASHVFYGTPHSRITAAIQTTLEFGAHGVDLFFVLSGLLITGILYESRNGEGFFRNFYARRILRIFPIYYAVLALYAIASIAFHLHFGRQLVSLALYLQNTYWITVPVYLYRGLPALPLGHFWTLAIEEQFYLVWPLIVFWLKARRSLLGACAAAILLCPAVRVVVTHNGMIYENSHANIFCRADSLLIGAALALLLRSRWHDTFLRCAEVLFVAAFALALMPNILRPHLGAQAGALLTQENIALGFTWGAFAAAGLIGYVLKHGVGRRLFSAFPLRWTGRYSYGMYVIHMPLFFYLQMPLHHLFARAIASKGAVVILTGFSCVALSMLLAWISYEFFEARFLHLKRFFEYRREVPATH